MLAKSLKTTGFAGFGARAGVGGLGAGLDAVAGLWCVGMKPLLLPQMGDAFGCRL